MGIEGEYGLERGRVRVGGRLNDGQMNVLLKWGHFYVGMDWRGSTVLVMHDVGGVVNAVLISSVYSIHNGIMVIVMYCLLLFRVSYRVKLTLESKDKYLLDKVRLLA